MKYADARPLIESGDVIFQSHRPLRTWHDLEIWLVRAFTRSKWDAIRAFFGASNASDSRWFCSELVCAVLGLQVREQTPAEVMRYLTEHEGLAARFVNNP